MANKSDTLSVTDFSGGINQARNPENIGKDEIVDWNNCILYKGNLVSDRAFLSKFPAIPTGYTPVALDSFTFPASTNNITVLFCNYDDSGTLRGKILYYYPAFRTDNGTGDPVTLDDDWGIATNTVNLPPFYMDELITGYFPRMNYTDKPGSSLTLDLTTGIIITGNIATGELNGVDLELEIAAAAANPTDTVLIGVVRVSDTITITITPNDGTNNSATPVNLTTAQLVLAINGNTSSTYDGINCTITDTGSILPTITASGGDATALVDSGEGDGVSSTFAGYDTGREETKSLSISRLLFCQSYEGNLYELIFDTSDLPYTATTDLYINRSNWSIGGFLYYKDRLFIWSEDAHRNCIGWSDPNSIRVDRSHLLGSSKEFNGGLQEFNNGGFLERTDMVYISAIIVWKDNIIILGDSYIERGEWVGQTDYLVKYIKTGKQSLYSYNVYNSYELQPILRRQLVADTPNGVAILTNNGILMYNGSLDTIMIPNKLADLFEPTLPAVEGGQRVVFKKLIYHEGLMELWILYHKLSQLDEAVPVINELTQDLSDYLSDFNDEQDVRQATFDSAQTSRATDRIDYWEERRDDWETFRTNIAAHLLTFTAYTTHGSFARFIEGTSPVQDLSTDSGMYNAISGLGGADKVQYEYYTYGPYRDLFWSPIPSDCYALRVTIEALPYYDEIPELSRIRDLLYSVQVSVKSSQWHQYDYARPWYVNLKDALDTLRTTVQDYLDVQIPNIDVYLATLATDNREDISTPTDWDKEVQGWYTKDTGYNPAHWTNNAEDTAYTEDFVNIQESYRLVFEVQQEQRYLKLQLLTTSGPKLVFPEEDFTNIDESGIIRYSFKDKVWYKKTFPTVFGNIRDIAILIPDFIGTIHSTAGSALTIIYPELVIITTNDDFYVYSDFDNTFDQRPFFITRMYSLFGLKSRFNKLVIRSDLPNYYVYYRFSKNDSWLYLSKANSEGFYNIDFDVQTIQFWIGYNQSESSQSTIIDLEATAVHVETTPYDE
jgi:hypothetical protein